jgi:hypothetical protein
MRAGDEGERAPVARSAKPMLVITPVVDVW